MNWLKQIEAWPKQVVMLACIVFITLVGLVDYYTGYEMFFFTFYLLAIFAGTWRVSVAFGAWLSVLSVVAWISSNIEAGEHYANYFVPVWNAAIMFTIYLIIVVLLGRLKRINVELEERVRLRTEALTREIQERMRLQKELLETSEREQRRIGRELHDGLCQHLTGTALAGHLLGQKLADKAPLDEGEAARVVHLLEEAIEMTRNLSHDLEPMELKYGELKDHFEDLAAGASVRFKVSCQFEYGLERPLNDSGVATHLYRIAQDAVVSAVKLRRAKQVKIALDSGPEEVVLTITDNGAAQPDAEGLAGRDAESWPRVMGYRADLIGAQLNIKRLATNETRVTCVWPLTGKGPADVSGSKTSNEKTSQE